jgi:hypothetical protein
MQALLDAVLCVANLLLCAAVNALFASFATVAFFKLVVFCVVEMRYLLLVFQAHDPQRSLSDGWGARRELAYLHARFYGALFAALLVLYAARDDARVVVVAAYSFWVPQIFRNAKLNAREPVCDAYLYGMAASRLLLPLYCLCDPDGLPRVLVVPSPGAPTYGARAAFALALVAWQGVQVGLLKLQQHYGARCFVPAALIPKPYDYRRPIAHLVKGDDANLECPICMGDVACDGAHHLVTPCDHVFHDVCLGQWMDLKTECPVCRAQLPPVDAGDDDGAGDRGDSPPNP